MAVRPYAKTAQILATVQPADRDRLDAVAEAENVSRAEMIRRLVLDGLDRLDTEPAPVG